MKAKQVLPLFWKIPCHGALKPVTAAIEACAVELTPETMLCHKRTPLRGEARAAGVPETCALQWLRAHMRLAHLSEKLAHLELRTARETSALGRNSCTAT